MRHAMEAFIQAGEWQKLDDYNMYVLVLTRTAAERCVDESLLYRAATTMFKEAADLAALLGEYDLAVKYYEDVRHFLHTIRDLS